MGTESSQSGFNSETGDIYNGTSQELFFIDINQFTPASGIGNHIPFSWGPLNMPEVDFYGDERTWPGAPGAVR